MSGRVPLEVGTRGTIGSLLKREIDYFKKVELERADTATSQETATTGGRRPTWPSFRFSMSSWRRRKKRRNSGICSVVEVADTNEIPGFGYLNLRAHSQRYDV